MIACRTMVTTFLLILSASAAAAPPPPRWTLELEGGRAWPGYNDVQIPNDDAGTRFSLTDDLASDAAWAPRARLGFALSSRSTLWALAAPLTVDAAGAADREIRYEGETFAAGTNLDATYQFNSYRLSYLYQAVEGPGFSLALGATVKVRDAYIELRGDGRRARKDDLGVVPLLGFDARLPLGGPFSLQLAGDALAAPQGRAEDVRAVVRFRAAAGFESYAGYRVLEGGADVDEVYTFAAFHYAVVGMVFGL